MVYYRMNPLRISRDEFIERMSKYGYFKEIEWMPMAFETDVNWAKTLEYELGYLYGQSLSSMIPPLVLGPRDGDRVLDMAAAPGSKSTQMAVMMNNKGVVVANDVSYMRIKSLASHVDRLGITNVVITNIDGRRYPRFMNFNKILLDAPCSSHGSRKGCRLEFSEKRIKSLARLQKALILRAFDLLENGGTMVYSTCTNTEDENEKVIEHLLEKRENAIIEPVNLPFPAKEVSEGEIYRFGWTYEKGRSDIEMISENVRRFSLDEYFFIAKISRRD